MPRTSIPRDGTAGTIKIYCNLIKATLILLIHLKLTLEDVSTLRTLKQVIYFDDVQIFAGNCISNILALHLEMPLFSPMILTH